MCATQVPHRGSDATTRPAWTRPGRARDSLGMGEIDEAELTRAGQRGAVVEGMAGDGKRAVSGALLRRCCHELKDQIDPRGLRLNNAVVTGALDLAGLVVPFPLRFEGCEFDAAPVVEGAQLFELSLTGCPRLPGLLGNGLRVRRDLDLSRSQIAGRALDEREHARSGRRSGCANPKSAAACCASRPRSTAWATGPSRLTGSAWAGAVRLIHQFRSQGEIRLLGARMAGLDVVGAPAVLGERARPGPGGRHLRRQHVRDRGPDGTPDRDHRARGHGQHAHRRPPADP